MNWDSFSTIGYLSVLLWAGVLLLWLVHWKLKRRLLCRLALALAVTAFVLAKINSVTHVNRIQLDRSAQMAEWEERQEASRRAALDSRGGEVAQIRFAEDAAGDFLDTAGLDEADLKYMEQLAAPSVPDWKKEKKSRAGEGAPDDELEALIGDVDESEGVDTEVLEAAAERPSVLMLEADMLMAHRLDSWNMQLTRILILLGLLIVTIDYLRRANIYAEASSPFRLPSAWLNALTPIPPVVVRRVPARRSIPAELAWLIKRGDSFVYFTEDPVVAEEVLSKLERFAKRRRPVEVLRVTGDDGEIDDDFVFEALWYGRGSFVVDSAERAERMLNRFLELLEERRASRARVRQTAHLVWDLKAPIPESRRPDLERLVEATGFSLFICDGSDDG